MSSAFGVEHGEISKWEEKTNPSVGRIAAGAFAPGIHGAVAGKHGHKLQAAGIESLGALASPPGAGAGTYIAHKNGWLKKQPKHQARVAAKKLKHKDE